MQQHVTRDTCRIVQQIPHFVGSSRANTFVGVNVQNPIGANLFQTEIARGGKVLLPRKMENLTTKLAGDLNRGVYRSGVDQHYVVNQISYRLQAGSKIA